MDVSIVSTSDSVLGGCLLSSEKKKLRVYEISTCHVQNLNTPKRWWWNIQT